MTNLTGAIMNLNTQLTEYKNQLTTKDSAMSSIQKIIIHLQGEIKTLKDKLSGQTSKRPDAIVHGGEIKETGGALHISGHMESVATMEKPAI